MRGIVLGSAAGGRVPQWNCGCANCREARLGTGRVHARSQDSLAVSADGSSWLLCNASPDIASQIDGCSALHPRAARHTPIGAIVLTNGDIDHCAGLLSMRESHPLTIYATATVWSGFVERNVLARTLQRFPGQLTWRRLELDQAVEIREVDGITITPRAVPGKRPVHLELEGETPTSLEDNIGLFILAGGREVAYVPGAGGLGELEALLRGPHEAVSTLLLDGTFWSDDELTRAEVGSARARDMAHVPISSDNGSLACLGGVRRGARRIYTHINNTNPVLREDSTERQIVVKAGWEVAFDGMEFS